MDESNPVELSRLAMYEWEEDEISSIDTVIPLPEEFYDRDVASRHKWVELSNGKEIAVIPVEQKKEIVCPPSTTNPNQYNEICRDFLAGKTPDEIIFVIGDGGDCESIENYFSNQSVSVYTPDKVERIVEESPEISFEDL